MKKNFIIFCTIGATAAFLDLLIFNLFFYFNLGFIFSRIIAIASAWVFVFSLNRNLNFKSRGKIIKNQFPKFATLYLFAMLINVLTGYLIVYFFGESTIVGNLASVIGIIIQIPITFFGSMFLVLKE